MTSRDDKQLAETGSLLVAKQFPLLRRFSIASLVAMLVTASILVFLYRQDQLTEHGKISAQSNEKTATQLIHVLGKQINALAISDDGLNTQALRNNPNIDLFPAALEMVRDYDILKLKIFNQSGTTIYSSVRDEIGKAGSHPDSLAKALAGETANQLEFRDTFLGARGEMRNIYVSSTYMPLVYAGKRIGAVEIYKDATPVFEHLNANIIRIPLIIFGGFALLYAALFFYVRRTDRILAEWQKALLESKKNQRLLEQQKIVQTSLDGFWAVRTTDARIIDANDAFCRMVGYSREELLTMRISDLEANESSAETEAHLKKIMEVGYDRFETCHRHKQGHLINLEINVSHTELDGGVIFVFSRDITERKRMLETLANRERELRALAESSPGMMGSFYLRPDGSVCMPYVSQKIWELFGLHPQDVVNDASPLLALNHPDDAKMVQDSIAESARTLTTWHVAYRILHPTKGERWMGSNTNPEHHPDGGVIWYGYIHDITERKLLEQQLKLKEFVLEQARDAVYLIDANMRFVYVNEEACRALGYSHEELLGLTPSDIDPDVTPKDILRIWEQILADHHFIFETRHQRRDGSSFPVEIRGSLFEYQGRMLSLALTRDITERKHAEQQLRELSAHIQTVREEEKAHLAREIHDDLGSTLAALKLRLSLLLDFDLPAEMKNTPLFARIESMLPIIDNAAASMRRIITDLRPSILEKLGLMAAFEWQSREFHKLTGIECRVACLSRGSTGCADCKDCEYTLDKALSINLFRIFQESLTNVARHSGASRVEIEFYPTAHEVVLSIRDNGRGLPEGHSIAATSYGMRGMRERVEQQSGKIDFDSQPARGLSVKVTLPVVDVIG